MPWNLQKKANAETPTEILRSWHIISSFFLESEKIDDNTKIITLDWNHNL